MIKGEVAAHLLNDSQDDISTVRIEHTLGQRWLRRQRGHSTPSECAMRWRKDICLRRVSCKIPHHPQSNPSQQRTIACAAPLQILSFTLVTQVLSETHR